MDIQSIRNYMRYWSEHTYEEGINACFDYSREEKNQGINILTAQSLIKVPMTGYSVEKIPHKWEGGLKEISMSRTFSDTIDNKYLTPASYIMRIIRLCNKQQFDDKKTISVTGRALRTLPSFIREMDLTSKIQNSFEGSKCYRSDPKCDINEKTDIFLEFQNETYRLWSYQSSTDNALNNTISKIMGERGELPNGYHILCPFNTDDSTQYENINGWKLYNESYVDQIKTILLERNITDYEELRHRQTKRIREYVRQINIFKK